ncbi:MAG: hypothetical protein E4H07_04890 [Nitrosomonadales bacterium]|nr:MAG: hypothetical protein E4H07_04890 [Nitrosomonadales bacterium]
MSTELTESLEFIPMAPEDIEIANTFITCQDTQETAKLLKLPLDVVIKYLAKPEVERYVADVYLNSGYRNRFKFGSLVDKIVEKKLEELEETGLASSKDIVDILTAVHKMKMEEMTYIMKLEESRRPKTGRQTNIQINQDSKPGYSSLFEKLLDTADI